MSYWLNVTIFWEISQIFNQNRSSPRCRRFLFWPIGHGHHSEIFSVIQAITHNVHLCGAWNGLVLKKNPDYLFFDFHYRLLQVSVVQGMEQLWQSVGLKVLQRRVSPFTPVSPFIFLSQSFCCLPSWRHTLRTEIMLGKFCHIVLSHPVRKLAFSWTSVFHSQLDKQELEGIRAEGSSLSYSISQEPNFTVSIGPISLSPAERFALLNSVLHSPEHVLQWGALSQGGLQWPSAESMEKRDQQICIGDSLDTSGCRRSVMC